MSDTENYNLVFLLFYLIFMGSKAGHQEEAIVVSLDDDDVGGSVTGRAHQQMTPPPPPTHFNNMFYRVCSTRCPSLGGTDPLVIIKIYQYKM